MQSSAPFIVTQSHGLNILRDDLLPGGTKRRGLEILLAHIQENKIGYAGTVMGHGALALAHACNVHGKEANIFISGPEDDEIILRLRNASAIVHRMPPLPVSAVHQAAMTWQQSTDASHLFPPGFETPEFMEALAQAVSLFNPAPYSEIWTTIVTGTLTRAIKKAFPNIKLRAVQVVKADCDVGDIDSFMAPEKYHRTALTPPPYPSCRHTDAKLWQFAISMALPGALIWNTAG